MSCQLDSLYDRLWRKADIRETPTSVKCQLQTLGDDRSQTARQAVGFGARRPDLAGGLLGLPRLALIKRLTLPPSFIQF